jgi:hypothetical protein
VTPQGVSGPGEPTALVQNGQTGNSVSISWVDGSEGSPQETYDVKCMMYGEACNATPIKSIIGIQRGTQAATINGLSPSTLYSCFVVATNSEGSVCSTSLTVNYQNSGSCTTQSLAQATKPKSAVCGTPSPVRVSLVPPLYIVWVSSLP